jgi:hypothetical protein
MKVIKPALRNSVELAMQNGKGIIMILDADKRRHVFQSSAHVPHHRNII